MDIYEYKIVVSAKLPRVATDELTEYPVYRKTHLGKLGLEGWEMVGVAAENSSSEWHLYFKRLISEK